MIINAIAIANGGSSKPPVLEELNATSNGTFTPSTGVDGFNPVNVNVPIPTFTTEELSVTANGTYTPSTDGYSKVTVAVPTPEPNLQSKSVEIVENGTQTISADEGYDGLSSVEVSTNVPIPTFTTEELSVTANGEYTPTTDGYSRVTVAVPTPEPNLQSKSTSITITKNGTSTITLQPDSNYDGLSSASVKIIANVAASMPIVKFYDGQTFKVGGDVDFSNWRADYSCTQLTNLFAGNTKLTSIDASNIWNGYFNASPMVNTYDISGMFSGCTYLTTAKINNWRFSDAGEMINMSNLFNGCTKLKTLEMKNFLEYAMPSIMTGMFSGCKALANIDFSGSSFLPTNMTWGLDNCPLSLASLVSLVDVLQDNSMAGMSFSAGIGSTNLATLQNGNPDKYNEFIAKGWTA